MCKPFYHFRIVHIISFLQRPMCDYPSLFAIRRRKWGKKRQRMNEMWLCVSLWSARRPEPIAKCECEQHDDSSVLNVLYHFSIPFYLALDISSMQTHPTIHLSSSSRLRSVFLWSRCRFFFLSFHSSFVCFLHANTAAVAAIVIIVLFVSTVCVCFFFLFQFSSFLVVIFVKFTCVSFIGTAV